VSHITRNNNEVLEWSLNISWEICNIFIHALHVSYDLDALFSLFDSNILGQKKKFRKKWIIRNIHSNFKLMNFLHSIWLRFIENYQYMSHDNNPSALKKLSRKHERKAPSDYMGKKFAALPNPAARLTSASFIFLIRRYGRKRQTINRTNGTSVRSAKRYNFSIYTRAW